MNKKIILILGVIAVIIIAFVIFNMNSVECVNVTGNSTKYYITEIEGNEVEHIYEYTLNEYPNGSFYVTGITKDGKELNGETSYHDDDLGPSVHFFGDTKGNLKTILVTQSDDNGNLIYNATYHVKKGTKKKTYKSEVSDDDDDSSSSSSSGYSNIFVKGVLRDYDFDGDGKISSSEWNAWCAAEGYDSMSNCDLNGDGYCSQSELATYSHQYGY